MSLKEKEFIIKVMTALGQMDHPKRCPTCKRDVPPEFMTMKLKERDNLLTEGWDLIGR